MSTIDESHIESSDNVEDRPIAKPIKKKALALDEADECSDTSTEAQSMDPHVIEIKARKELNKFLTSKGVDPKSSEHYKIHVRLTKQRKDFTRKSDSQGYTVSYTCPDGSILMSKFDVLTSINDMKRKNQNSMKNWLNNTNLRKESHDNAAIKLNHISTPVTFDTITVLNFGSIDKRSDFHNAVQVFPLGYRCEQVVSGTSEYKGNVKQTIICEIAEMDDLPEFRITVKSTGNTYLASSEQSVWRKFNPNNLETDWNPSFFNLEIELLIEGMSGVLDCSQYKFHSERGYGNTYFTNDESFAAKQTFLAKSSRERRNQERQMQKHLTREEQDKLREEHSRRLSDEKEVAKKLAALEKERREAEKEKAKALKEKQKLEEARRKEHTRAVVKSIKEKHRKSDKLRQQFKRDVLAESKKNKTEASAIVLQYFDDEEEMEEHAEQLAATSQSLALTSDSSAAAASVSSGVKGVRDFVSALPTLDEQFDLVSAIQPSSSSADASAATASGGEDLNLVPVRTSVDEVMQISTTLHLFRKHLNVETSVSLDNLIHSIVSVSCSASASAVVADDSSTSSSSIVPDAVSAVVVGEANTCEMMAEDEGREGELCADAMEVVSEGKSDNDQAVNDASSSVMNTTTDHASVRGEEEGELLLAVDDDRVANGSTTTADKAAMNEEEWDEPAGSASAVSPSKASMVSAVPTGSLSATAAATVTAAVEPKNQSSMVIPEAEMDKIQLKLMKALLSDLHRVLDLEASAADGESVRLPLNQLTWQELARMAVVNHIYTELGKTKDDAQHAVRGGKHPNFKTTKNIVRNIRYKLYLNSMSAVGRAVEPDDFTLQATEELKWLDQICRYQYYRAGGEDRKPSPNEFNTEAELLNSLEFMSNNASQYSEAYRRCARVMIKVLNMSAAKNLIWEVDSEMYPDYYSTISRPIMFANIATNLVNRTYSEEDAVETIDGVDTEKLVALLFYQDMMQVVINCFTYNTEVTLVVAQAYKVLCAIRRYMQVWVIATSRPAVEACDEKTCLLTGTPIFANIPGSILKCGKCTGAFSCEAVLQRCSESEKNLPENRFLVQPSNTVIDQTNEEWVCPFCLNDAFTGAEQGQQQSPFCVDEWGPSGLIPWMLNGHHSAKIEEFHASIPHLLPLFNALRILTRSSSSSVCDRTETTICGDCIEAEGGFPATRKCSRWTFADRVTVLGALCRVLRVSDKSIEVMSKIYTDCEKLMRIGNKPNFREADFMEMVKELSGEEGVTLCRSLLDGIDSNSESYLQNIITEGRCVVCNGSTLEEDMAANSTGDDEEGQVEEIILCDGCNAEVHLSCLNLSVVPSGEWHCNFCKERLSLRDTKVDRTFDNIDKQRDRDIEEDLLASAVERRCLLEDDENNRAKFDPADETKCRYCGMTEFDLCSPLVVGQSRSEHDAMVALCTKSTTANFGGKTQTVRFLIEGTEIVKPTLDFPYFPLVESPQGQQLVTAARSIDHDLHIAHQVCALQMFQARAYRNRHNLRRRRKVIGKRVVTMSGISTKPLGYDDSGLEFWKLPTCEDLFIYDGKQVDPDRTEFMRLIGRKVSSPMDEENQNGDESAGTWKRVSELSDIRLIVDLLGSSMAARDLKKNLILSFLSDRKAVAPSALAGDAAATAAVEGSSEMAVVAAGKEEGELADEEAAEQEEEEEEEEVRVVRPSLRKPAPDADKIPVALKLLPNKGTDILKTYVIQEETVFEEGGGPGDGEEEQETSFEYFTFSKNRKYYATALINSSDNIIKANSKTNLTIIYQIHREGIAAPLTYAPLSEPWTDHLYYFSTVNFKKSGRYTISFLAEGANAASIKPLIFTVTVEAKFVRCGLTDALRKLNASTHVSDAGRQVLLNRREVTSWMLRNDTELSALKGILFTVYAALPNGALTVVNEEHNMRESLTEPSGWNDALDQLWRGAVVAATTPIALMECVLLLEYYLNKAWFTAPYSRLLQCLPSAHFAIRCATFSSVALRIYSIDKALDYEKVYTAPREKRGYNEPASSSRGGGGASGVSGTKARLTEDSFESNYRSQRSAATAASSRIRSQASNGDLSIAESLPERRASRAPAYHDDFVDYEEEQRVARHAAAHAGSSQPQSWTCTYCHTVNEPRARSCSACDERKPALTSRPVERYNPRPKRGSGGGRGRGRRGGSDDDDDDDDDNEDSEDSSSGSEGGGGSSSEGESDEEEEEPTTPRYEEPTKRSGRKRAQVSYREDDPDTDNYDIYFKSDKNTAGGSAKKSRKSSASEAAAVDEYYQRYIASIPEREAYYDQLIEDQRKIGELGEEEEADKVALNIKYLTILRRFVKEVRSEPFWEPVDTTLVSDYLTYISDPMDLGTITERVVNGYYSNSDDENAFPSDVRLVWNNCKTYNLDYSLLHQDAIILGKLFEDLYYDIVLKKSG